MGVRGATGTGIAALALLLAPAVAVAAPQYVDVAAARGLSFTVGPGTHFAQLGSQAGMLQRNMGNGAAVGDYDGDGDLDVYLLGQLGEANALFRNDLDTGTPGFTDVTAAAGLGDTGLSRVAAFVDLDNDGDLDLILLNDDDGLARPPSKIFRNDGGTFTDVTAGSGFDPLGLLRCGMAIGDYDRDGLLDVYVTDWAFEPGWNRLYRNLGGLQFQDTTAAAGLPGLNNDSYSAVLHDFDGDLWPDLFVAVDHESDEFFWNDGGTFTRATESVGATHTGNDMGVAVADFDDDGDVDTYATNITDASGIFGTTQYNALQVSLPDGAGRIVFDEQAVARGVANTYWGWGVEFTDADNDTDLDIVAVTGFDEYVSWLTGGTWSPVYGTPAVFFQNDGTGQFARLTPVGLEAPDDSRALIAFDHDRDGDEDLLVANVNGPVRLYDNVTSPRGHWLSVELEQTAAGNNRRGIGAAVLVDLPGRTLRRDLISGDSYLSGTPAEVHVGLGDLDRVPALRVRWTDGSESSWADLEADRHLRIVQGVADADLDGVTDPGDNCATAVNPDQTNGDTDDHGDACDCATDDGALWALPGEPGRLDWDSTTTLGWGAADPGSDGGPVYDLLRSPDRQLAGATCVVASGPGQGATDPVEPPTGGVLYYRVRAVNGCGATPAGLPDCP